MNLIERIRWKDRSETSPIFWALKRALRHARQHASESLTQRVRFTLELWSQDMRVAEIERLRRKPDIFADGFDPLETLPAADLEISLLIGLDWIGLDRDRAYLSVNGKKHPFTSFESDIDTTLKVAEFVGQHIQQPFEQGDR